MCKVIDNASNIVDVSEAEGIKYRISEGVYLAYWNSKVSLVKSSRNKTEVVATISSRAGINKIKKNVSKKKAELEKCYTLLNLKNLNSR